jgi:hypothetical protein
MAEQFPPWVRDGGPEKKVIYMKARRTILSPTDPVLQTEADALLYLETNEPSHSVSGATGQTASMGGPVRCGRIKSSVPVTQFDSGLKRLVQFSYAVDDLLGSFLLGCADTFPDEIEEHAVKIYAYPHGVDFTNLPPGCRIDTSAQLRDVLLDYAKIGPKRLIYLCVDKFGHSPTQVQQPAKGMVRSGESATSYSSYDTDASRRCRELANSTCAFCGCQSAVRGAVHAVHLFELKHYSKIRGAAAQTAALREKGLGHIHDIQNMICLCGTCHGDFEGTYNVGIVPDKVTLVKDPILEKPCGRGKFGELRGRPVTYARAKEDLPPLKLLRYRYEFYTSAAQQTRAGAKGKGAPVQAAGAKRKSASAEEDTTLTKLRKVEDHGRTMQEAADLRLVKLGYEIRDKEENDTARRGVVTSSTPQRGCTCKEAYEKGGGCERHRKWYR